MAKKLLVRTPVTADGLSPQFDQETEKKLYNENILELSARPGLESINSTLPEQLKHKFEEIDVDEYGKRVMTQTKPSLANAADLVKKIQEAASIEEVDALSAGDTRKTVVDAAAKRLAEIAAE